MGEMKHWYKMVTTYLVAGDHFLVSRHSSTCIKLPKMNDILVKTMLKNNISIGVILKRKIFN